MNDKITETVLQCEKLLSEALGIAKDDLAERNKICIGLLDMTTKIDKHRRMESILSIVMNEVVKK